jgi:hypothetical protein
MAFQRLGAILLAMAVLTLPCAATTPQEACVSVAEYAKELAFVIQLGSTGHVAGAEEALNAARTKFETDLGTFRITAGPKSREFGLSQKAGIDVWRSAAAECVTESKCSNSTAKPAAMYSTFLIEFCRQDYEDSL